MAFNAETATLSQFRSEIKSLSKAMGKVQDRIHFLCLGAAIQWLKHDNPDWAIELVTALNPFGGSVRVQAVAFWFREAVGLNVTIDPKTGTVKASKNKTFDWERESSDILAYGRKNPYHQLAPKEKPLNADAPKPDSAAVMWARALEAETVSESDFDDWVNSIRTMIPKKRKDPKVIEWVKTYKAQVESVATH